MTGGRLGAEATGTLDHLQNEQVTVSETDKEFWVTWRRVHAFQESFQCLGGGGGGGGGDLDQFDRHLVSVCSISLLSQLLFLYIDVEASL